jgi:hypothetical protein
VVLWIEPSKEVCSLRNTPPYKKYPSQEILKLLLRNMKKNNMTPLKVHNSSITKSKDIEMVELQDKELKSLVFKITNSFKKDLIAK